MNTNPVDVHDVTGEEWREYIWPSGYRFKIENPLKLYHRIGGCTHNIEVMDNMRYCMPNVMYDGNPTGVIIVRKLKLAEKIV